MSLCFRFLSRKHKKRASFDKIDSFVSAEFDEPVDEGFAYFLALSSAFPGVLDWIKENDVKLPDSFDKVFECRVLPQEEETKLW